jgi:hypothetical protein
LLALWKLEALKIGEIYNWGVVIMINRTIT